ncbi:MAG: DUF885 domain-containing protein [Lachnospiraceae bacterium]|nr:DUF885 domain-containing protein [Lachnospiraceae bacterium]
MQPFFFSKRKIHPIIIPVMLALLTGAILLNHRFIASTDSTGYRANLLEKIEYAKTFSDYTAALFCYEVTSDSITTAYTLKNPSDYNIPELPATLSTFRYSQYNTDKTEKNEEKLLTMLSDQLSQYDKSSLSEQDQLTYALLARNFDLNKQLAPYAYYEELLGATTGVQANLPVTLGEYPLRTEKDIKVYLSLLTQIPTYFDNVILYEKHRQKAGFTTPDFMLNDTLDGLNSLIEGLRQDDNCFAETFEERVCALNSLPDKKVADYCQKNREYIRKYVIPSYEKLQQFIKDSLNQTQKNSDTDTPARESNTAGLTESSSRNSGYIPEPGTAYGLASLPDGANYYALLVKSNTGSNRSPKELIAMTELALKSSLGNVLNIALTDQEAYFYYCDNPIKSYYENPNAILEALSLLSRENYPVLTTAPTYTIKSVPDSLAAHLSPAFYMIPAIDDFTDNTIYINQLYTSTENGNLFTTLAHEGFPGHLYQTVYFNSLNPPVIRQILDYPGYVEGWATYVEMNSFHYIDYPLEGDSLCTLYQSDTIISLALSSRVDLGVNYEGWTLNDVNQFFEDNGFNSYYAADVYAYVVEAPATYLRYFIGYLEIEQLKNDYKNQEMENFSEKEFHQKLLDIGPADFETIREKMLQ